MTTVNAMPEGIDAKIRVQGLTKSFGAHQVLRGVDLVVPRGKKSVLIGPAASGKTVLLKCMAGIEDPDAGSVMVDGEDMTKLGSRDHARMVESFGILFQQGGLFDSMTVWENIAFKLTNVQGVGRKEAKETAVEMLALVSLPAPTADLYPVEISGGMQKRVGFARAMVGNPELLLLDEPTAGLDPITTKTINRVIDANLAKLGATVFAITSDMQAAHDEYDFLFMLHDGEIKWAGPTSAVEDADDPYVDQMIHGRAQGPIQMRVHARDL
jgi:phospholipid/cholesterol/gamma-HCH transport system ATP-binding protein